MDTYVPSIPPALSERLIWRDGFFHASEELKGDTLLDALFARYSREMDVAVVPCRWYSPRAFEKKFGVHFINKEGSINATVDAIVDLLRKAWTLRAFIVASGKSLVSTPLGQSLIDMTPDTLRDPVITAQGEQRLEAISRGETSLEDFMYEQYAALPLLLNPVLSTPAGLQPGAFPCPKYGKAMRRTKDKNGGFFWACSDPDCHSFLPDADGKPGAPREKAIPSEFPCPVCGKPLLLKSGTSKTGKTWERFDCSGFPSCKSSFWGDNGKPNFDKRAGTK